jgi:hypothetical protein
MEFRYTYTFKKLLGHAVLSFTITEGVMAIEG